jgi:glycosyltransferase involved in cell wall biosynthesis
LKIPLVFTEHSNHNRRRNYKQILFLERFIYKKYKTIICISNEVKRTLLEHLKISVNCVVVYNGIDLEKFKTRPLVCPFEKEPGEISLVQVARFRPEKDQKTCIYAMELLPKNYKLYFIGDGPTMEEHILLVKNLSLENQVIFMGAIDKIEKFLPYFDIGIISSHWEGFGLAAVEYMAAGIITIVGDIPSLSEITSNSAVSFKYKCGVDLSNKIISVINNNFIKEQMIISGQKRAQNFKIENNIKKSISLYQSI